VSVAVLISWEPAELWVSIGEPELVTLTHFSGPRIAGRLKPRSDNLSISPLFNFTSLFCREFFIIVNLFYIFL
jgi:hypothetical protein